MDGLKARLSFDAIAYDYDDEYLTIDTETHEININNVSRLFGVQYDGNSKLIKFRIRNKLSEIQKMQDSIVYINWIDQKGVKGQSIAIDKTISNDICEFAWKVPFDALKNSGVLHFAMSAVVTKDGSSVIDQRWSTQIASVLTPDGIYIKSYTPSSEEEDRIAQIYNELSKMINKQYDDLRVDIDVERKRIDVLNNGGLIIKDELIENNIKTWLDEHPEATTTVLDNSLTINKMVSGTLGYVTPELYGAVGDGVTDDTNAINDAFNSGYAVFFSPKTYLIDGVVGTTITDGIIIGNNATLKIKPNDSEYYIGVKAIGKTLITDLTILGDRDSHIGTTGEFGHCLSLLDCYDTVINNVTCNKAWGDGLYIGCKSDDNPYANNNINILNCRFDNNRRNNISVTHGTNVIIDGCTLSNANGKNPQSGIDIEPNNAKQKCNILVKNCLFLDNHFGSISVVGDNAKCSAINCVCDNQNDTTSSDFNVYSHGQLTVCNTHFKNAKDTCFYASSSMGKLVALNTTIDKLSKQLSSMDHTHTFVKGENGATLIVDNLLCADEITTHMMVYANDPTVNIELSNFNTIGRVNIYHRCNFKAKNMPPYSIGVANLTIENSGWWPTFIYNLDYDGTWNISTNIPDRMLFIPATNKKLTLSGNANYAGSVGEQISVYKQGDTYKVMCYNTKLQ